MMTDPIADMLTRIRNALLMKHEQVTVPYSRMKEAVLKIIAETGFIKGYEVLGESIRKQLVVQLKYAGDGKGVIANLKRVSKPSRRIFSTYEDLKPYRRGFGVQILSTSRGVLSDEDARRQKVGGEIIMEIW